MADGCRLAVDVILPDGDASQALADGADPHALCPPLRAGGRAATSSRRPTATAIATCSCRAAMRWSWSMRAAPARSFGTRDSFRSPRERADYKAIADWIVAQPWSDGRDRRHRHLLSRRGLRFPGQHRPQGGQGDRAAVRRLGHLGRQLLSRRHADQAAGAGLRRADAGARPRPPRPAQAVLLLRQSGAARAAAGRRRHATARWRARR